MSSRLHDFVDSLNSSVKAARVRDLALNSVVFHCGEMFSLPMSKVSSWEIIRPPFPVVCLEFEGRPDSFALAVIAIVEDVGVDNTFRFCVATKERTTGLWGCSHPVTVSHLDSVFSFQTLSEQMESLQMYFVHCANVFQVLRCSNVSTEDNHPPLKLNKKREARGRCPIFTFKTLICNVPNQQTNNGQMGGTHASPRVHLRRGFIRTIQSGKTVWVQSCVVGSKHGLVAKDYRLRAIK